MLLTNSTNRSTYLQFDVNSSRLDINLIISCRMSIIPVLMVSYCFDYFSLSFDLTLTSNFRPLSPSSNSHESNLQNATALT